MRLAPIGAITGSLINFDVSDDYTTTGGGTSGYTGIAPGTVLQCAPTDGIDTTSNVPNWIANEIIYALNTSSSTFTPGRFVHIDKNGAILDMPNTAGTGRPVYLTLSNFAAGNTTTQGGWLLRRGIAPAQYGVAATAGPVYFAAAGVATPTLTAGKQVLNATCLITGAATFTRSGTTQTGSSQVAFTRVTGMFVGQAISGTGIPASSVISSIDPGGRFVIIGSAIGTPVTATASATVTVTMTNTNYGIVQIDNAFVQGNIT